jgi:predicted XRE-type DNA-binding protein
VTQLNPRISRIKTGKAEWVVNTTNKITNRGKWIRIEDLEFFNEGQRVMIDCQQFESVWEALEDDPIRVENLKLRSVLLMEIAEKIRSRDLTQAKAAEVLCVNQPRVSALLQGKIEQFRLDGLVDMAHRLGLNVSVLVAA